MKTALGKAALTYVIGPMVATFSRLKTPQAPPSQPVHHPAFKSMNQFTYEVIRERLTAA